MRKILFLTLIILPIFLLIGLPNPTLAADPPTPVDTGTVPVGATGCSYKTDTTQTPIAGSSCKSGSTCAYVPGTSTVSDGKVINGVCQPDQAATCYFCGFGSELLQQGIGAGQCHNLSTGQYSASQSKDCTKDEACSPAYGCISKEIENVPLLSNCGDTANGNCDTALGLLPTDLPSLLTKVFSIALAIAGIAALGLIITSGYRLMVSQGNPEQVKGAREQLTAAIIGLLFIIFSLVILQVVGVNIINIPDFGA